VRRLWSVGAAAALCALSGCVGFNRAANGILPDRFGIGRADGVIRGFRMHEYQVEPDRDLSFSSFYMEWDVPQLPE